MSKITLRAPVSSGPKGVPGLVRWIKMAHPSIYRGLAQRLATSTQLQGLGLVFDNTATEIPTKAADSGSPGIAQTIVSTVSELAKVALPLYQQQQLFNLQVKRAQAGQPMLDASSLSDLSSVKLGVDSSTRNTLFLVGGLAIGGLLLYKLVSR